MRLRRRAIIRGAQARPSGAPGAARFDKPPFMFCAARRGRLALDGARWKATRAWMVSCGLVAIGGAFRSARESSVSASVTWIVRREWRPVRCSTRVCARFPTRRHRAHIARWMGAVATRSSPRAMLIRLPPFGR
ncbi:hypothetical protein A7982_12288 [Minicystis rosea]|nr:hypothetical protein A7982_12288 [Minicystis rosea]